MNIDLRPDYATRFISPAAIFSCAGTGGEAANRLLRESMTKGISGMVQLLRCDPDEATRTCWLHGEAFCLSTPPVGGASL